MAHLVPGRCLHEDAHPRHLRDLLLDLRRQAVDRQPVYDFPDREICFSSTSTRATTSPGWRRAPHERILPPPIDPEYLSECSTELTDLNRCFTEHSRPNGHRIHLTTEQQEKFMLYIHRFEDNTGYGADVMDRAPFMELMLYLNLLFFSETQQEMELGPAPPLRAAGPRWMRSCPISTPTSARPLHRSTGWSVLHEPLQPVPDLQGDHRHHPEPLHHGQADLPGQAPSCLGQERDPDPPGVGLSGLQQLPEGLHQGRRGLPGQVRGLHEMRNSRLCRSGGAGESLCQR